MKKIELSSTILQKHLEYCQFNKSGSRTSVKKKLKKEISNCSNVKIKSLLEFLHQNLVTLAIGNPRELNELKEMIYSKIKTIINEEKDLKGVEQSVYSLLKKIFHTEYNRFVKENNLEYWGAYAFVEELGISVCPYCNSQFIFVFRNKNGQTRPVLDHYFCKSKYPFLAISIYNLIPCCKVCNSDFKGHVEVSLNTHIHPYLENFHEYVKFKRELTTENTIDYFSTIIGETNNFNIVLEFSNVPREMQDRYKNHAMLFRINDIYQFHKRYVRDLILKSRVYTDVYKNQLKSSYSKLFNSNEELDQILIPKDDDINNIILSKLTRDIVSNEITNNVKEKNEK
ncbi:MULTISPECIES: hypothetical protein [Bacillus cereus group]|uniref:hypothetical protein n=1 Tax=Bacillus cereus group TaxID=86661 RepID=UPI001F55D978|nr:MULTISPECIES: hypothetical protein [Bacillus cereus group]MDW3037184.1 hypothetical protein [Bacillus pacificus]